jgi:hypothetical protein
MWPQPREIQLLAGQVGQESHRRPAVVEHAARCLDSSSDVQIAVDFAIFGDASSSGV